MDTAAKLLGRLSGLLGQTYLFAGLLPAVLLLLGLGWYLNGPDYVVHLFTELSAEKKVEADGKEKPSVPTPPVAAAAGIVLLRVFVTALVGLIFFGGRQLVLQGTADLRGLSWLRRILLKGQDRRRRQSALNKQRTLDRYNLILWPASCSEPPNERLTCPSPTDFSRSVGSADWAARSHEARNMILRVGLRSDLFISAAAIDDVVDGLASLQMEVAEHGYSPDTRSEISEWIRMLCDGPDATRYQAVIDEIKLILKREAYEARQRASTPTPLWIAPTDLGNRLAILDDYSAKRYRITTSVLWPRLWPLLSEDEKRDVSNVQTGIYAALNTMMAFVLLGIIIGLVNLQYFSRPFIFFKILFMDPHSPRSPEFWDIVHKACGQPDYGHMLFFFVSLLLAWCAYRSAVFAMGTYVEQVIRAVDLNRLKLPRALGLEDPDSVAKERRLWNRLDLFFTDGFRLPGWWKLKLPAPAPETTEHTKSAAEAKEPSKDSESKATHESDAEPKEKSDEAGS